MAIVDKELNSKFYFILINLPLNSHMCIMAAVLDSAGERYSPSQEVHYRTIEFQSQSVLESD